MIQSETVGRAFNRGQPKIRLIDVKPYNLHSHRHYLFTIYFLELVSLRSFRAQ